MMARKTNKTFIWITEEWLIILIAILILLAIAIGAAGARTLITSPLSAPTPTQTTMSATPDSSDGIE